MKKQTKPVFTSAVDMNLVSAAIELRKQVRAAAIADIVAMANEGVTNKGGNKVQIDNGFGITMKVPSLDALKQGFIKFGRNQRARKILELGFTPATLIGAVTVVVGGKLKQRTYQVCNVQGWTVDFVEIVDKVLLASLTDAEVKRYFPGHTTDKPSANQKPIAKPVVKPSTKPGAPATAAGSPATAKKPTSQAKPAADKKAPAKPTAPASQADKKAAPETK